LVELKPPHWFANTIGLLPIFLIQRSNPRIKYDMNKLPRVQFKRSELKPGEILCDHCTAKCCRYFSLPIDEPDTFEEFEYLRWYVQHDQATIFTEDDSWFVLVHTVCKHLRPDNRCGIYKTRLQIGRIATCASGQSDCRIEGAEESVKALIGAKPSQKIGRFPEPGKASIERIPVEIEQSVRHKIVIGRGREDPVETVIAPGHGVGQSGNGGISGVAGVRADNHNQRVLQRREGSFQSMGALLERQIRR
ncbi:MAG: hypothetical protein N2B03_08420, partial [Boseongicola sp.]